MCLERALKSANLRPEDVNYINAHGTSTPAGDMAEYRAIAHVFPQKVWLSRLRAWDRCVGPVNRASQELRHNIRGQSMDAATGVPVKS